MLENPPKTPVIAPSADAGRPVSQTQVVTDEWVTFPGGELEGKRPRALCSACRGRLRRIVAGTERHRPKALCFQCYRAELERQKALGAAGQLDTASDQRFQFALPFEPVNRPRLEMLKADRAATRALQQAGTGRFAERRRQAQIVARRALQSIACELRMQKVERVERDRIVSAAIRAAELQLPEAWLPFVVSR